MMLKRIYRLLLPEERRTGIRVAVAVFLTAVLDFVGLASLLPVLYYLLEGGEQQQAALWFCLLAVAVILFKGVSVVFFTRFQNRFLLALYRRFSFSLFSSYYHRGLLFIREQGSSRLGHEVNVVCFAFSQSVLSPILRMAGDSLLILLVSVALWVYDWRTVLLLYASFLPFMAVYVLAVRKKVKRYGAEELQARRAQTRVVTDTFRGFAELAVSGAFKMQQASFLEGMDKVSRHRVRLNTILRFPLLLSELSVVVGLTLLVAWGTGDVKVLVGIFAVAAFRLLPALRAVVAGWTQLQNASYCLDVIEEGLKGHQTEDESATREMSFERDIVFEQVSYAYPDSEEKVLDGFSASIRKGEHIGFRGYSGVGKSTLFNLLLGLIVPTQGEIRIDGVKLSANMRSSWLRRVGYVPQDVFIFNGTLAENVALGCREVDKERVERILCQVSLGDWLQTLPDGVDSLLGEAGGRLSGGQRQRIGIARAIYKEIDILLLDEATSALDNETEKDVNETLGQLKEICKGLTVLTIAHRESSLAYCDRIITLER